MVLTGMSQNSQFLFDLDQALGTTLLVGVSSGRGPVCCLWPAVFRRIAAAYWTVKTCVLVDAPPAVVTVIGPVVAPAGTMALMTGAFGAIVSSV